MTPSRLRWSRPRALALLVLPAIGLRLLSFGVNDTPHGDVTFSAVLTETLADGGGFVFPCRWIRPYSTRAYGGGMPMDGQPPLWPILAVGPGVLAGDGYTSLKLLSMLAGIALLPVSFVTFRSIFGRDPAALATIAIAYAFVMIDYSANASLYSLLALAFIGFAHLLSRPFGTGRALGMGAILGASLLLHQSAIVLLAALLFTAAMAWRDGRERRPILAAVAVTILVAGGVLLPWWIRNLHVFGDPFFQSHHLFVLHRMGVPWRLVDLGGLDLVAVFDMATFGWGRAAATFALWLVRNAGFLGLQLLFVGPLLLAFAAAGAVTAMREMRRGRTEVCGVLVIPVVFAMIACAWPIFQFRCLVVLVPFGAGLGAAAVFALPGRTLRSVIGAATIASVVVASAVSAARVPSRTYYYGSWESTFQEKEHELRDVADLLAALERGPVLSDELNLYYYTRYPWTFLPPAMVAADMRAFVEAYDIRYVMAAKNEAARYREVFASRTHHEGRFFLLLEIG